MVFRAEPAPPLWRQHVLAQARDAQWPDQDRNSLAQLRFLGPEIPPLVRELGDCPWRPLVIDAELALAARRDSDDGATVGEPHVDPHPSGETVIEFNDPGIGGDADPA